MVASFGAKTLSGQGLAPNTPAKEYIRPNGQIIAIESGVADTSTGGGSSGSAGYQYARSITIPHSLVPNTDQTNFPVLFTGTYSFLATTANGGQVQNPSGYDVVFTSDAAGTNELNWEVESYQATTGAATYWIQVRLLSHTAYTTIYMFYGNASVTSDQSNPTGTWDTGYGAVWHLGNGTNFSLLDSTSNANNGSNQGASAGAGEINTGANLNNGQFIQVPGSPSIRPQASITAQAIVNFASFNTWSKVFSMDYNGDTTNWNYPFTAFEVSSYGNHWSLNFNLSIGGSQNALIDNTVLSPGTWYWIACTYDGTTERIFVNGVLDTSQPASGPIDYGTLGSLTIGIDGVNYQNEWLNGSLDELRISSVARSADWLATEYNNQSNPAAFVTVGAQTSHH